MVELSTTNMSESDTQKPKNENIYSIKINAKRGNIDIRYLPETLSTSWRLT